MRYADGSYDYAEWTERRVDGGHGDDGSAPLTRDYELGQRASEALDILEDERDVRYWADLAQVAAMGAEEARRGEETP